MKKILIIGKNSYIGTSFEKWVSHMSITGTRPWNENDLIKERDKYKRMTSQLVLLDWRR